MNDKKTEAVENKEDKKTDTKLPKKKKEIGGADGPEPTRFGDWEKKGIASDFWKTITNLLLKFLHIIFSKLV